MEHLFDWFSLPENKAERDVEKAITYFFNGLDDKHFEDQRDAILQAVERFKGKVLSQVIHRLKTQYQCNINQQNPQGRSALHIIAHNMAQHAVHFSTERNSLSRVLDAGVDPNLQDQNKNTLLHLLSRPLSTVITHTDRCQLIELINELVVQKKADLMIENVYGNTVLHEWIQYGDDLMKSDNPTQSHLNVIRLALKLASDRHYFARIKHAKNIDGNSLLHIAAIHGQPKTVKLLLDLGWNVNCKNKEGITPLHYAVLGASKQHIEVVDRLLAVDKMDVNIRIKHLDYTAVDLITCVFRYMERSVEPLHQISTKTCAAIYMKLLETDNSILHFDESPLEDIQHEIKRICEQLYYTCSPLQAYPQLYIGLNTRYDTTHCLHVENKTEAGLLAS